nr:ABC transporter permease [Lachnospiraceae bacterium]
MRKYIGKRILISIFTLLLILLILFILISFMPGSPFNDQKLSQEQIETLYRKYGLDKPLFERYLIYVMNMLRGDFGVSYSLSINTPITQLLSSRFPVSAMIGFLSMVVGSLAGIILGFCTAFYRSKPLNAVFNVITVLGIAVPSYLLAILFSYYVGYKWDMLPLIYDFRKPVSSLVMPVMSMSMVVMAVTARFSQSEAQKVISSDYVLFAKCQGITDSYLMIRYVILNSVLPVITVMASLLVGLITGSLVIESMFAIPGIGSLMSTAIAANDYNVILALSFVYSAMYIVVMLFLDIL